MVGCDDPALLKSQNHSMAGIIPFNEIGTLATAADDSLILTNRQRNLILKIDTQGSVKSIAGNGKYESTGDGAAAISAGLKNPLGVKIAADGSIYFVEMGDQDKTSKVRKITPDGKIASVAGIGEAGDDGEEGLAKNAKLMAADIAVGTDNQLFIADQGSGKIKMVDTHGFIHTIAGGGGATDWEDNAEATSVKLSGPSSIAITNAGIIYFIDNGTAALELAPHSDGSWTLSHIFGGKNRGEISKFMDKNQCRNSPRSIKRPEVELVCA